MKIKLSKSQWELVGKTAGWMKTAVNEISILHEVASMCDGSVRGYVYDGMSKFECAAISCGDAIKCIEEAASEGIRGARFDTLGRNYIVYWPSIAYTQLDTSKQTGYLNSLKGKSSGIYIVDETGILEKFPLEQGSQKEALHSWSLYDMEEKGGIGVAIIGLNGDGEVEWIREPSRYNPN